MHTPLLHKLPALLTTLRTGRLLLGDAIFFCAFLITGMILGVCVAVFLGQGQSAKSATAPLPYIAASSHITALPYNDSAAPIPIARRILRDSSVPPPAPLAIQRRTRPDAEFVPERRSGARDFTRSPNNTVTAPLPPRPRIAIIIDDLGPVRQAYAQTLKLPPPITMAFLPYAPNVQHLAKMAAQKGHGVMLHLPMEPNPSDRGMPNPGPSALMTYHNEAELYERLHHNLDQFHGYQGVNNHMGSRFTQSLPQMRRVMKILAQRNLYFLDSLTTTDSVAATAARLESVPHLSRDVFIDTAKTQSDPIFVKHQLAQVEKIAQQYGTAVAIGHPYPATLKTLGSWLTSVQARGFDIVTTDMLMAPSALPPPVSVDHFVHFTNDTHRAAPRNTMLKPVHTSRIRARDNTTRQRLGLR